MVSSHPELWNPLLERLTPIGEGDLKLSDVTARVHAQRLRAEKTPLDQVSVNLLQTIDTDSFAIELIQQARRAGRTDETDADENTFLCLREPGRKRSNEEQTSASFLVCDIGVLYNELMGYVYGKGYYQRLPGERMMATALFCGGMAMAGCDFVQIQGIRCDLIMPCVRDLCRSKPQVLATVKGVFSTNAGECQQAQMALQELIDTYIKSIDGLPRRQKTTQNALQHTELQLLRTVWILCYWSGREFKDTTNWGFSH